MGVLDLSPVSQAKWFSMPQIPFADFSFSFNFSAIITMVIIYIVLMAETTGTWFAISNVIDQPLTNKQINRGVVGEGIGLYCFFTWLHSCDRLFNKCRCYLYYWDCEPSCLYSRGIWFIVFGFSGKLAALISAIPSAVIGGVFVIVCGIIAISGLQVMKNEHIGEKEMYVIAIPVILTLALTLLPDDFLYSYLQPCSIYLVRLLQPARS